MPSLDRAVSIKTHGMLELPSQLCENQELFSSWSLSPAGYGEYHMGVCSLLKWSSSNLPPFPCAVTRRGRAGSPHLHPFPSVMKAPFPDSSISAESVQGQLPTCQPGAHQRRQGRQSESPLTSAMGAHSSFNFSIKEFNKEPGCLTKPVVERQCLLPCAGVVSDSLQKQEI